MFMIKGFRGNVNTKNVKEVLEEKCDGLEKLEENLENERIEHMTIKEELVDSYGANFIEDFFKNLKRKALISYNEERDQLEYSMDWDQYDKLEEFDILDILDSESPREEFIDKIKELSKTREAYLFNIVSKELEALLDLYGMVHRGFEVREVASLILDELIIDLKEEHFLKDECDITLYLRTKNSYDDLLGFFIETQSDSIDINIKDPKYMAIKLKMDLETIINIDKYDYMLIEKGFHQVYLIDEFGNLADENLCNLANSFYIPMDKFYYAYSVVNISRSLKDVDIRHQYNWKKVSFFKKTDYPTYLRYDSTKGGEVLYTDEQTQKLFRVGSEYEYRELVDLTYEIGFWGSKNISCDLKDFTFEEIEEEIKYHGFCFSHVATYPHLIVECVGENHDDFNLLSELKEEAIEYFNKTPLFLW